MMLLPSQALLDSDMQQHPRCFVLKRISLIALVCIGCWLSFTQQVIAADCPNFNYDLRNQAAVDAFPANCDVIGGDLSISGADIRSLQSLSNLSLIRGNLTVSDTTSLSSLGSFSALTRIEGGLDIHGNSSLSSLNGLHNLQFVSGYVYVYGNPALYSISSLSQLTSVGSGSIGGSLNVSSNAALRDLSGLAGIRSIGSDLYLDNNPLITDLSDLANLDSVGRDLNISSNAQLRSMSGLSLTSAVGRSITINNNPRLTDLGYLASALSLFTDLDIRSNALLQSLSGLSAVTSVGSLRIENNDSLLNLDSLSNLGTVNGYLYLRNNDYLADLNGLVNVNRVYGTLHVIFNYRLADCRGLAPLLGYPNGNDSVSLGIYIYGNSQGCNSSNDILLAFESDAKITEAYIGLLGRAPDPAGLEYWSDELLALVARGQNVDIALKKLTNDITLTPEWIGGGGSGGSSGQSAAEAVVSAMYINLFSRQATAADLAYWSAELTNRRVTESEMVVLLIQGAQSNANTDSQVLEFKRQAASYYVSKVPQSRFSRSSATEAVRNVYDEDTLWDSKRATDRL